MDENIKAFLREGEKINKWNNVVILALANAAIANATLIIYLINQ